MYTTWCWTFQVCVCVFGNVVSRTHTRTHARTHARTHSGAKPPIKRSVTPSALHHVFLPPASASASRPPWTLHACPGGVLSLGQELMDSGISGDWGAIAGDPVKFGLGAVSIVYDVIFCLQHFVWYAGARGHGRHDKGQRLVDDDEVVGATDAVTVAVG